MFGNNRLLLQGLTRVITIEPSLSCHSDGAFHYCHSDGALRLCHPEERSDEGSSSGQAARPKNLNVAQGKLPEEESLEILRCAQNDIWLLNTLGYGGAR
jgi:hypothetical protein